MSTTNTSDIDVTDTDELREYLLGFVEDSEANDADAMEDRALALLAGARRAKSQGDHSE